MLNNIYRFFYDVLREYLSLDPAQCTDLRYRAMCLLIGHHLIMYRHGPSSYHPLTTKICCMQHVHTTQLLGHAASSNIDPSWCQVRDSNPRSNSLSVGTLRIVGVQQLCH